jgi:hypothetical protein
MAMMAYPFSFLPGTGRETIRRMVVGYARARLVEGVADYGFQIRQHIGCWNAQHCHADFCQPGITNVVALRSIATIMGFAVYLDRQPGVAAKEIEDVGACGMLAAELDAGRALSQFAPEKALWQAHRLAQYARALDCASRPTQHHRNPSTMLRMVPLPETSSGGN